MTICTEKKELINFLLLLGKDYEEQNSVILAEKCYNKFMILVKR